MSLAEVIGREEKGRYRPHCRAAEIGSRKSLRLPHVARIAEFIGARKRHQFRRPCTWAEFEIVTHFTFKLAETRE